MQKTPEPVEITCPNCGEECLVIAEPYDINFVNFDTVYDPNTDEVNIDWDSMEIEANYSYHCDMCGCKLGNTTDEIKKLYLKERNQKGATK